MFNHPKAKAIATLATAILIAVGHKYLHIDLDDNVRAAIEILILTLVVERVPNRPRKP